MSEIPEKEVTLETLAEWYKVQQDLAKIKSRESLLRSLIFGHFFPQPKEGTNTFVLPDEHQLKGIYVVNRAVDPATVKTLRETFIEQSIPVDDIVTWKPELVKREYNKLTEEEKHLFDQCLIVKPGAPQLEIKPPAKKRGGKPPSEKK